MKPAQQPKAATFRLYSTEDLTAKNAMPCEKLAVDQYFVLADDELLGFKNKRDSLIYYLHSREGYPDAVRCLQTIENQKSDEGTNSLSEILVDTEMADGYWPVFLPLAAPYMIRKLQGEADTIGEDAYWENRSAGEEVISDEDQESFCENREALMEIWSEAERDPNQLDQESIGKLLEHLREI